MPESTDFQFVDMPTPNMAIGRDGMAIRAIVLHRPEGEDDRVIEYLQRPTTQKSYHYLIKLDGTIVRLVPDENTAWHTGVVVNPTWAGLLQGVNPNLYTIGIAIGGFAADNMTDAQKTMLTIMVGQLCKRYNLPINTETIVYHREIRADKSCPGDHVAKEDVIINAEQYNAGSLTMPTPQELADAGLLDHEN